jgi:hypothetical protein
MNMNSNYILRQIQQERKAFAKRISETIPCEALTKKLQSMGLGQKVKKVAWYSNSMVPAKQSQLVAVGAGLRLSAQIVEIIILISINRFIYLSI